MLLVIPILSKYMTNNTFHMAGFFLPMYLRPKFGPIPNGFEVVFFPKMFLKIPNRITQKKKKKNISEKNPVGSIPQPLSNCDIPCHCKY